MSTALDFLIHLKVVSPLVTEKLFLSSVVQVSSALQVTPLSGVCLIVAAQLARLSGFSQIIATSSKKHESLLKKFGATHIIDRSLPVDEQVKQIQSIAPALEYAWDAIGNEQTNTLAARSLSAKGGLIVSSLPVSKDILAKHSNVKGKNIVSDPILHEKSAAKIWSHVEEALRSGKLLPIPHQVFGGLASTAEALQAVKKASGYKVIVRPQE